MRANYRGGTNGRHRPSLASHARAAALFVGLAIAPIAPAQTGFYATDGIDLSAYPPGALIRVQAMDRAPENASAFRVLYASRGLHDESVAVSGVVLLPNGPPPAAGRPIIAWAHPTSGIEDRCAPSLAFVFLQSVQGLRGMLDRGYVVTATDYPGLGTAGVHPYLIGDSEARAVIDSVRAAHAIAGVGHEPRYTVWGHSQGGQAALFTAMQTQRYAPELTLIGVAAAAPATDLAALLADDWNTAGGRNITAMTLWSWSRLYDAPLSHVVAPAAIPVIDTLASDCIERFFDVFERIGPTRALARTFLSDARFAQQEPWRTLLANNSATTLPPAIPVFIAQGTDDGLVLPAVTSLYRQRLCAAGSKVHYLLMPGVSHGFAGRDAADAAVQWMADRFEGREVPDDCATQAAP